MAKQLDKLKKMLMFWLKKNGLDTDTHFYTAVEWKEQGEEYHNDAELVITTEGGLNFILNWGDSSEFRDLVDSFPPLLVFLTNNDTSKIISDGSCYGEITTSLFATQIPPRDDGRNTTTKQQKPFDFCCYIFIQSVNR